MANVLIPKYEGVDEKDAVTLLSIPVETERVDHPELFSCEFSGILMLSSTCVWMEETARSNVFDSMHYTLYGTKDIFEPHPLHNLYYRTEASHAKTSHCARGRRITAAHIGADERHPLWEFHAQRVFELLAKLEKLEVLILEDFSSIDLTETVSRFPNLKALEVRCYNDYDIEDDDNNDDSRFFIGTPSMMQEKVSNLECLYLGYCIASEDELAIVLLDVLPFFPKLVLLSIGSNKIGSFQRIAQRIRNSEPGIITSRLRRLYLGLEGMPPLSKQEIQQSEARVSEEIEAVKTILLAFKELPFISGAFVDEWQQDFSRWCDAGVTYLRDIDQVSCRVLVESNIPLSVWPDVLSFVTKLTYSRTDKYPDAIYYLLQNVPALQEGGRRRTCKNKRTHSKIMICSK